MTGFRRVCAAPRATRPIGGRDQQGRRRPTPDRARSEGGERAKEGGGGVRFARSHRGSTLIEVLRPVDEVLRLSVLHEPHDVLRRVACSMRERAGRDGGVMR